MDVLDKFFELGKMSQTLCESLSRIKRDDPVIYDSKKVYDFPTKVKNKTKIVHKHDQWYIKTTSYIPIPSDLHITNPSSPDTELPHAPTPPVQESAVTVTETRTETAAVEEEQFAEDVIEQLSTDSSQQSQNQRGEELHKNESENERKDNLAFFVPEEAENGDASTQFAIDNYSQMYQF